MIGREGRRREVGAANGERVLVPEPIRGGRVQHEARFEAERFDNAGDLRIGRQLDSRSSAARVLDHIAQRIGSELRVERHRHDSRAHRAEHDLDEFYSIADRHGETIAALQSEARQRRGDDQVERRSSSA